MFLDRYRGDGLAGLARVPVDQIPAGVVWLVTDGDFTPIAGNLPRWPTDVRRHGVWMSFALASGRRHADRIEGQSFALPVDANLLVGRLVDRPAPGRVPKALPAAVTASRS